MTRTAVLYDEKERPVGRTTVPEQTFVIEHKEAFYFRTPTMVRLPGGGLGARFVAVEPLLRNKLEPA